ncbi:MAG: menaquinone biosynthetic enzyme MqnA/MqnD family protein [Bacteroidia bacterium]
MNEKIKISAVAYLNSKPFIYGLERSPVMKLIDLQLDIPSECARKLIEGQVDVGLIPVAVLPLLKEKYIISDYCIGAVGRVNSVMLYSDVPLEQITAVLLDYQSRTSVTLVRVLAANFWKISPGWIKAEKDYENKVSGTTAAVIIGDRTFGLEGKYKFAYDLAEEWQKFTGLPFVFACWTANKLLPEDFIAKFNSALKLGLEQRPELIPILEKEDRYATDIGTYLLRSISYDYDAAKKQALDLFLTFLSKLEQ